MLWEAQFGDFANGAQVMIDQYLAASYQKWGQTSGLVLLLPHGYEGQGPEHSSARLERFLQLAAQDNLCVANCTTSGQYFHLLRRQAALLGSHARPLVLMTPKSLLRHPLAGATLEQLATGRFQPVLVDQPFGARPRSDALVLCSGKLYVTCPAPATSECRSPVDRRVDRIAVAGGGALSLPGGRDPRGAGALPRRARGDLGAGEPRNMGAWSFVEPRLRECWAACRCATRAVPTRHPARLRAPHAAEQMRTCAGRSRRAGGGRAGGARGADRKRNRKVTWTGDRGQPHGSPRSGPVAFG